MGFHSLARILKGTPGKKKKGVEEPSADHQTFALRRQGNLRLN